MHKVLKNIQIIPFVISVLLCDSKINAQPSIDDLITAIHANDAALVTKHLNADLDANAKNPWGVTPLGAACQNGNHELVEILLKNGANATDWSGGEPVIVTAARTGNLKTILALLDAGADPNAKGNGNQTVLMWTAAEGHHLNLPFLIGAGADKDPILWSGFDALMFAIRAGHIETAKNLINIGCDINKAYSPQKPGGHSMRANTSPLLLAIENGHLELALELIKLGADPNDQRSGLSPLHAMVWVRKTVKGDGPNGIPEPQITGSITTLEFVRQLVTAHKAEVNLQLTKGGGGAAKLQQKGATPFLLASLSGDLPLLKLLYELGADPAITNTENTTPLLAAVGIGVTAPGEEQALEEDSIEAAKFLLSLGADINHVDDRRETVMHAAAYKASPKVMQFLDQQGADIKVWNTKNKQGRTPLLITQGFRPGNFRPIAYSEKALGDIMRKHGIEPPASPPPPNPKVEEYVE